MTARRLPIGPLLEAGLRYGTARPDGTVELDDVAMAVILNVNSDSLGRWRRRGWVAEDRADHVATMLGRHPADLWPDEWLADVDVDAVEDLTDEELARR